jgi:hypothetical protein
MRPIIIGLTALLGASALAGCEAKSDVQKTLELKAKTLESQERNQSRNEKELADLRKQTMVRDAETTLKRTERELDAIRDKADGQPEPAKEAVEARIEILENKQDVIAEDIDEARKLEGDQLEGAIRAIEASLRDLQSDCSELANQVG